MAGDPFRPPRALPLLRLFRLIASPSFQEGDELRRIAGSIGVLLRLGGGGFGGAAGDG